MRVKPEPQYFLHVRHDEVVEDDGGWTFNWLAWSPAAEREWRGFLTVDALRLLRANGYLSYP